ncbi:MAG: GTPase domain-containing protein [Clostridiales bacterium]|jgi:hypothetical protein|nr:GTPase domain-containing protein [Clostridiales bacterium]
MLPVFPKGVYGCLYCMKKIDNPMLQAQSGDDTSADIDMLRRIIEANKDEYSELADLIKEDIIQSGENGKAALPYFTIIKPWADEQVVWGPLKRVEDDALVDFTVSFTDEYKKEHRIVYDKLICPYCLKPLNTNAGKKDMYLISVLGIRNIGKSQFVNVIIRKCQEAFRDCGFTLMPIERTDAQRESSIRKGVMEPTQDTLDNEDNFYTFLISWDAHNGESKSACLVFQDTPGERMLVETSLERRLALISRIIKSNIVLLFSDPTRTYNFLHKLEHLESREIDLLKTPDIDLYYSKELRDIIEESRAGHFHLSRKNSFEETVEKFCSGLDHIRQELKDNLTLAVVYTKLDLIEYFTEHFDFYTVDDKNKSNDTALFVKGDPVFQIDPPKIGDSDIRRDWIQLLSRGQAFMKNEDNNSFRRLEESLKRRTYTLPCFMISNGRFSAEASFDNSVTISCLSLLLWIIETINPLGLTADLKPEDASARERRGVWDLLKRLWRESRGDKK